jgi:hypothetical protein
MGKISNLEELIDWAGRFQLVKGVLVAIWPAIFAGATAFVGFKEDQPYMWIIMASFLVFMAATVAFVYVSYWKESRTPVNKLRYMQTVVNYELVPFNRKAERAKASAANKDKVLRRQISKTQIGVMLRNEARFPISVLLYSAETEMEGEKPPRSNFPKSSVILLPGNTVNLLDMPIDMKGIPCEKLEGNMNLVVKYGFPGKENNKLEFRAKVEAMMQPSGFITGIHTAWESPQIRA